ncbi:MAG TPA: ATP-binding protein, partial [Archangium sp.]|nr:ATP-binding protein [Archangium sp.]
LLADDNADMREYVRRLLKGPYTVEAVENGTRALEAARARPPDLVLSDVMMPGLDGFGLVRELKEDPRTAAVPVILLSARAGEEATVEGLESGADDYLVKPFSARELVTRVEGTVKAARARQRAEALAEELRQRADFEQQLIGIVSHDLRTPVSAILLGVTRLLRGEELSVRQTKSVVRIQSSAERAHRMIRDLLDFTQARLAGGLRIERRPTDLHALIQGVLEEIQAAHDGRELRFSRDGDGRGEWDPDRLGQAVQNLVTNALKYSPGNTPVRIETHAGDSGVAVSIHNEGAPIPPDMLGRIFQPLQRASGEVDKAGRSIGLGLYIVKQVVDAHGGTVSVESSAEAGTTFTVWLPRHTSTATQAEA